MSEQAAPAAAPTTGWYYLDAQSQPIGPYDTSSIEGLAKAGYISSTTLLWRDGREKWLQLSKITELASAAAASTRSAANGAHQTQPTESAPSDAAAGGDDVLAAFQAEISAIEAQADDQEGGSTPEELEFEDDDGTRYIWDRQLRKYVAADGAPAAAAAAAAAASYDESDMVFVGDDEEIPSLAAVKAAVVKQKEQQQEEDVAATDAAADAAADADAAKAKEQEDRKRKAEAALERHKEKARKRKEAKAAAEGAWVEMKRNTSVYVDGLPDDTDEDEVAALFSKCGILRLDDNARPRVKLYRDKESGMLKGDALVTYLKEASVELALQILDGSYFRHNSARPLSVSKAKFEMKGEKYMPKKKDGDKVVKKKLQHKAAKALGWDGFDDEAADEQISVVLHHVFHPDDFLSDINLAAELEEDLTAECGKLGQVQKVKLFKSNPEGVAMIKYKTAEAAQKCLQLMHGRWFGGRQLVAHLWDGLTNYNVKHVETAEEQEERLERFARELEEKGRQQQQQQQQEEEEQQQQEQQEGMVGEQQQQQVEGE